jgi:hypothetical protein
MATSMTMSLMTKMMMSMITIIFDDVTIIDDVVDGDDVDDAIDFFSSSGALHLFTHYICSLHLDAARCLLLSAARRE